MTLHADAVAQNRASGVRAGGIDRDDSDSAIFFAVKLRKLIDQRALAPTRRTSESDGARVATVSKEGFKQVKPTRAVVLDGRNSAGEGAGIAGAKLLNPWLEFGIQTSKCKTNEGRSRYFGDLTCWRARAPAPHGHC